MDGRQGERNGQGGALMSIERAAGGIEAYEWTELLLRMYQRWAERHGLRATLLDQKEGEEAGIAYAWLEIDGPNVYGRLKAEHGVHRLVRVPPSDPAGRRHVSFAIVLVTPAEDGSDGDRGYGDLDTQIRTYVMHPSTKVTDHRTGLELSDVESVLDGEVDPFIDAYLRQFGAGKTA